MTRKEGDNRRRGNGVGRGENQILGGSDPALCGLPAAQRLRRRGSLPPKWSSRIPRSVAGRVAGRKPNNLESLTAEEMKIFGSPRRGSAHDASAVCGFPQGRDARVHYRRIVEASSVETRSSTCGLKRITEVRLQPLTHPNPQAQLPRTQQTALRAFVVPAISWSLRFHPPVSFHQARLVCIRWIGLYYADSPMRSALQLHFFRS